MSTCELLDTFPAFLAWWSRIREKPLDEQIEAWASEYMSPWPDLLRKQIEDYAGQGVDWRRIARERVFPYLGARLAAMQEAHSNLLEQCLPLYAQAQSTLGFESHAVLVIYVGIGCGAGWVTPFRETLAILFGLENIAECGWSGAATLSGLIAHEIGHLAHYHWRRQHRKTIGRGAWWQIYEEGFAQYCEGVILGAPTWHQAREEDWLAWCRHHRGELARRFLRGVDSAESLAPLFGSWLAVEGRRETGYYLGWELIGELHKRLDLKSIALLDDPQGQLRPLLEEMGKSG